MNTIYIVCLHHPHPSQAFRVASREGIEPFTPDIAWNKLAAQPANRYGKGLEKFFETHKLCGGGFDHFALAFELPKDHDLPKAEPLAEGVHAGLRLVKANGHEH